MVRQLRWLVLLVLVVSGGAAAAEMVAEAPVAPDTEATVPYVDGVTTKLARGVTDILTAPLEFMRNYAIREENEGFLKASMEGTTKGALMAVTRAGVGVFEVVTCFTPHPHNFQPVMQPEVVYANGEWQQ